MTCNHGLPAGQCAICNHTTFERPEFHGAPRPNEEPRLVKGRDKAEWQGVGRTLGSSGSLDAKRAAAAASPRGPWVPRSNWAREQFARTQQLLLPPDVQRLAEQIRLESIAKVMHALEHAYDHIEPSGKPCDVPKNHAPAIPDGTIPSKWDLHHSSDAHKSDSERRMRHARKPGKAGEVIHARTRV